jgi:hypothetical protein
MRWKIRERVSARLRSNARCILREMPIKLFGWITAAAADAFGQISNCWPKIANRLFLFRLDWEVIKVIGYCAACAFWETGLCSFVTAAWAKIAEGIFISLHPWNRVMSSSADPAGFRAVRGRLQTKPPCVAIVCYFWGLILLFEEKCAHLLSRNFEWRLFRHKQDWTRCAVLKVNKRGLNECDHALKSLLVSPLISPRDDSRRERGIGSAVKK